MKSKFSKWSRKSKKLLKQRLKHDESDVRTEPVFTASNIRLDYSERISAISCGGIGAVHMLVKKIGLDQVIDSELSLLKVHKPYRESDHILNMIYNIVCGGRCPEDIELLRNNATYMDAIGADRIPDPTTAGDFLRRFGYDDIVTLMDVQNRINRKLWSIAPRNTLEKDAIIDVDGMVVGTYGETKEKMDMSYKGIWGFVPLIITEATTGLHLYTIHRSGNQVSHSGAVPWIDKSIELVRDRFRRVHLRGDSDFSLTENFDGWDADGVEFYFSFDSLPNLVEKAFLLPENRWKKFDSVRRRAVKTKPRGKKRNVKKEVIKRRGYENRERVREYMAEFDYRPNKCEKPYRMIAIKRELKVEKGQLRLEDETRYFFYVTNNREMSAEEVVRFQHGRCNHENKIEQLKNGVRAMKNPAAEFFASWAYMVICSMAWNVKSWMALVMQDEEARSKLIRMEYKRFKNYFINIPCQIIKTGRTIVYRILNYTPWTETFWSTFHSIREFKFAST